MNWTEWVGTTISAVADDDGLFHLYLYGTANTKLAGSWDNRWVLSSPSYATVECAGNIETLRGATGNLPAPKQMAERCYSNLFAWSVVVSSDLEFPAISLSPWCYEGMLQGTSTSKLPKLPATNLPSGCYSIMFKGCSNLELNTSGEGEPWSIPTGATKENDKSVQNMFSDTKGTFTGAPTIGETYYVASAYPVVQPLPVRYASTVKVYTNETCELTELPYRVEMGANVTVIYTADEGKTFAGGATTWMTNFTMGAYTAVVTVPHKDRYRPAHDSNDCLAFTSKAAFSLSTLVGTKYWDEAIYYSTDKSNWCEWTGGEIQAVANSSGTYRLYLYGEANTKLAGGWYYRWVLSSPTWTDVECTGNIETLRGATGDQPAPTQMANNCYDNLFSYSVVLASAPALPATSLSPWCYAGMFQGTRISKLPELPATVLPAGCYYMMFYNCASLILNSAAPGTAWSIPAAATTDEGSAWNDQMFIGTGGTFTGEPVIGTTYYCGERPILVQPTALENASTVKVYTNGTAEVAGPPYNVTKGSVVSVVYTADIGYVFPGNASAWTTTVTAAESPLVVTVPEAKKPTLSRDVIYHFTAGVGTSESGATVPNVFKDHELVEITGDQYIVIKPKSGRKFRKDDRVYMSVKVNDITKGAGGFYFSHMTADKDTRKKIASGVCGQGSANGVYYSVSGTLSMLTEDASALYLYRYSGTKTTFNSLIIISSGSDVVDLGGGLTAEVQDDTCTITGSGELTDASALKEMSIANLVIGAGITKVGDGVFNGWRSLRDVTLGADCKEVGKSVFLKCHNITNVTSLATGSVAVGDYAFYRCNSLQALSFAEQPNWGTQPFSFQTGIYMKDGLPEVYAMPDITITGYSQVLKGSKDLKTWEAVTDETKKNYNFFRIDLEAVK